MNKYIPLLLCLSLPVYAQNAPEVEMASETVAVPELIETIDDSPFADATADSVDELKREDLVDAKAEENTPEALKETKVEEATAEMEATTTPDATIPIEQDLSEPKEPEIAKTNLSDSMTPTVVTEIEKPEGFEFKKSHWQSIFAFENFKYQTPFNYVSSKGKSIYNDSKIDLYGARLGFGHELYLFGGLSTTSRIEGFYTGTAFGKNKSADPDFAVQYANSKAWAQNIGFDVSQSLSYIMEVKTKNPFMDEVSRFTIEPFVEAGIGASQFMSKASFHYDTTAAGSPGGYKDDYRHKITDNIVNARIGAGFNVTALSGFFMFARVTQNRFNVTSRKSEGYSDLNGTVVDIGQRDKAADKNVKLDPVTMFTIGGGYKF